MNANECKAKNCLSLLAPLNNDNIWNYKGIEFFLQYAMLFAIAFVLLYFIARKVE